MNQSLEYEFPGPYPYEGRVVDRNDPNEMGGVRFIIPGEIDVPSKVWAYPIGLPAAGGADHGLLLAPPEGADVLLWFIGGDRENVRYLCGHYGRDEVPQGTAVTSDGDNVVWRDKRLQIEVDSRATTTGVRITDKATGAAVKLDVDAASRQVEVSGLIGVLIKSTGLVRIEGGQVLIQGRVVLPSGEPI